MYRSSPQTLWRNNIDKFYSNWLTSGKLLGFGDVPILSLSLVVRDRGPVGLPGTLSSAPSAALRSSRGSPRCSVMSVLWSTRGFSSSSSWSLVTAGSFEFSDWWSDRKSWPRVGLCRGVLGLLMPGGSSPSCPNIKPPVWGGLWLLLL
jgi:hypothetical protein